MGEQFSIDDLDYELPPDRIAQAPAEQRDSARLLLVERHRDGLADAGVRDLPDLLRAGDCLVINDTRVVPARFEVRRHSGGGIEGLFVREVSLGCWQVLLKRAARVRGGERLLFSSSIRAYALVAQRALGAGCWEVTVDPPEPADSVLQLVGRPPLPPYIHRRPGADPLDRLDATRYQTVFASVPGAVAAPTAGLHFTAALLDSTRQRGVDIVPVTLHVGLGTFSPIVADRLDEHPMHAEWFRLSPAAAERIDRARGRGGRVVAVGTTSARVLESRIDARGRVSAGEGWTQLFIRPPHRFAAVDALLTNFHLPRSTLLALVMAFAGVDRIRAAYRHAIDAGYRFYSYGDAMLII